MNTREKVMLVFLVGVIGFFAWKFFAGRPDSELEACLSNLRAIDGAKLQAAMEMNLKPGDDVPRHVMMKYRGWPPPFKSSKRCRYTEGVVGTPAKCSVPSHKPGQAKSK